VRIAAAVNFVFARTTLDEIVLSLPTPFLLEADQPGSPRSFVGVFQTNTSVSRLRATFWSPSTASGSANSPWIPAI